jgi:DNA helicase-2/ATP-dependent DNA helicase PcrA
VNPRDEEALKRIINYPARGIGKTTLDKLILEANTKDITLWEAMDKARELGFRAGTLEALEAFVLMIKSFKSMLGKQNAYDVAFHVGKHTNLVRELFINHWPPIFSRSHSLQMRMKKIRMRIR